MKTLFYTVFWTAIIAGIDRLLSLHGYLLAVFLFLRLLRQQFAEAKLRKWVESGSKPPLPSLPANMEEIAYRIHKQREQSRKRKKRLQRFLAQYRELVESVPEAAIVIDQYTRIIGFNRHAQQLLNIDRRLDSSTQIDFIVRCEGISSFWEQMKTRETLIVRLISNDDIRLEFTRASMQDGSTLLVARNITEFLRLDSKRKAFIDNASHELKTPLTVIRGFLEVMRGQEDLPHRWAMPVEEMYKHAERMHLLTHDMLKLASLENPDNKLNFSSVHLRSLLEDIAETAAAAHPDAADVRVIGTADTLSIDADAGILHSMIANLVTNAQLHAQSEKPIEISAAEVMDGADICVRDFGIGISPADCARITERFYRVDKNRRNSKGSGLGLAIVKHGAEAHGGTLEITSELGEGSTFILHLPKSR